MSRQVVNRLLIGLFVIIMFFMGVIYVKQERKMELLQNEYNRLTEKCDNIEYVINEYTVLIDSMNSKNFVIRIARDMFGWVFDNETIYKKSAPSDNQASLPYASEVNNG